MATRSPEADAALRELTNRLIGAYNACAQESDRPDKPAPSRAAVTAAIAEIWRMHLEGGRFEPSDGDILAVLRALPSRFWPEDIYLPAQTAIAGYLGAPLVARSGQAPLNRDSRYLLDSLGDETSQMGENGIIERIFQIMEPANRWCVEFGAWDGKRYSNTWPLVMDEGWHGVLIEGNEGRFAKLEDNYRGIDRVHLFNMMVGFDPASDSIDHILERTDAPRDLDMMIVDIDGNDWHVWQSMTVYRPRLMVVEFNPSIANDVVFVQERDPERQQGCSLSALIELARTKGYELVCATTLNGFFVVQEAFEAFDIADNSIDAMYEPAVNGRIFQAYDSTVHVAGMREMLWDWKGLGVDWTRFVPDRLKLHDWG